MKMAFISDIHGNPQALDAVLADIAGLGGVDEYWFLGDFAAIGPDPVAILERVDQLSNVHLLRGNTDRFLVTGERPHPRPEDLERNPGLAELFQTIDQSFGWTAAQLGSDGWLDWIARLPLEQRATLPDGTRLLAVHASPDKDDGRGINPVMSDEELSDIVAGAGADLVLVGHTHWPVDRKVAGVHIVNLGSVSNPFPPDLRSCYVLLEAAQAGYRIEHRRVDYDHQQVIERTLQVQHPAANYIIAFMRGQNRPGWAK